MNASFELKRQEQGRNTPRNESQSATAYPSRTIVHAKLEMTEPGDHDEQEADAVANTIMSGAKIARKISSGSGGSTGIAVSSQMESQLNHLQGGGQAMPEGLRSMMESGFGQDFGQVRLHTDSEAASLSSCIHAKAFTHGNDIYFNRGQFSPETSEGQRLVAHELAHVAQGGGKVGRDEGDEHEFIVHNGFKECEGQGCSSERKQLENDRIIINAFQQRNWPLDKQAEMQDLISAARKENNQNFSTMRGINSSLSHEFNNYYDPRNRLRSSAILREDQQYPIDFGYGLYPKFHYDVHLIIGHGEENGNSIRYNGVIINNPNVFKKILKDEGRKIKPHDIVIFATCELGKGNNSFAQRFSAVLQKNIVIASDEPVDPQLEVVWDGQSVLGMAPYFCSTGNGAFLVFRNGKRIDNKTLFGTENGPFGADGGPDCVYGPKSVLSKSYFPALERFERSETMKRRAEEKKRNAEKNTKIMIQEIEKIIDNMDTLNIDIDEVTSGWKPATAPSPYDTPAMLRPISPPSWRELYGDGD